MIRLARSLVAPAPGWTVTADVVVVGSGVAGLTAALRLRGRVPRVVLVTKAALGSGSTVWAQGGIAAALAPGDSTGAHLADTLAAGVGLCDPVASEILVAEGPDRVRELVRHGAVFDTGVDGGLALTREGGHGTDRIVHAGGDATGVELSRALVARLEAVRQDPGIEVIEQALVVDVLTGPRGRTGMRGPAGPRDLAGTRRRVRAGGDAPGPACGVLLHVIGAGSRDGVGAVLAPAVVLATGGIGQVFRSSTNPAQATGDGLAAALRAGAAVADVEFVQFHPTVLWLGSGARGQLPLISEALRGEGAVLLGTDGVRFMPDAHPRAELAPRDVVAHAIVRHMAATESDHVLLDARHLGRDFLRRRFPTIDARLRARGFDLATDLVPVAPAQHYHSGGVLTDVHGRTSLDGLYAVGEVACTGVHGANRLASNSLLEGLVFAHRVADDVVTRTAARTWTRCDPVDRPGPPLLVSAAARTRIQQATQDGPGVLRSADRLAAARRALAAVPAQSAQNLRSAHPAPSAQSGQATVAIAPQAAEWETSNIHQVATVLTEAADLRTESRGGHFREDHPATDPAWRARLVARLDAQGTLVLDRSPVQAPSVLDHRPVHDRDLHEQENR